MAMQTIFYLFLLKSIFYILFFILTSLAHTIQIHRSSAYQQSTGVSKKIPSHILDIVPNAAYKFYVYQNSYCRGFENRISMFLTENNVNSGRPSPAPVLLSFINQLNKTNHEH